MPKKRAAKSVKTANANLHSLLQSHRSRHLDLFLLEKQKEILTTENDIYRCKFEKNRARLKEIEKQINQLTNPPQSVNRKVTTVRDISDDHSEGNQRLKTMKLGY